MHKESSDCERPAHAVFAKKVCALKTRRGKLEGFFRPPT
jgi:hypothetical protein